MKIKMKQVRNWLRREVKRINQNSRWPAGEHLAARIVSWDRDLILVVVYDKRRVLTQFNSRSTRWVWVSLNSRIWRLTISNEISNLMLNC